MEKIRDGTWNIVADCPAKVHDSTIVGKIFSIIKSKDRSTSKTSSWLWAAQQTITTCKVKTLVTS